MRSSPPPTGTIQDATAPAPTGAAHPFAKGIEIGDHEVTYAKDRAHQKLILKVLKAREAIKKRRR